MACSQVETATVRSFYRWQGEVEDSREVRAMFKLPVRQVDRLRDRLAGLHPYELPEFVVLDAAASDAYAQWVDDCCP